MYTTNNSQTIEHLNLKAVVERTGVKAVTLRAWERRYGILNPDRTSGGQRIYTQADVELINWLVEQRKSGLSISKAVDAWRAGAAEQETRPEPQLTVNGDQFEQIREAYVAACQAFDEQQAQAVLDQAFARWHPQLVVTEILLKSTARMGQLWRDQELTVQQEHFATTITMRYIERLIAASPPPVRRDRILVACAPGDYHSLSTLVVSYFLRQHGFPVIHLGANVPAAEMNETLAAIRPKLLILSAQRLNSVAQLPTIAQFAANHGVLFGFGGAVFNQIPALQAHLPGHFLGNSLDSLADRVTHLIDEAPDVEAPQMPDASFHLALAEFEASRNRIESDVWRDMLSMGFPTRNLTAMNQDLADALGALLRLGAPHLLEPTVDKLGALLISYRPKQNELKHYLRHYGRAVRRHLEHEHLVRWFNDFLAKV